MASVTKILVKQEVADNDLSHRRKRPKFDPECSVASSIIDLSSSDSESDSFSFDDDNPSASGTRKSKMAVGGLDAVLPLGFLDPLPSKQQTPLPLPWREGEPSFVPLPSARASLAVESSVKQFWKAGDYEGTPSGDWGGSRGGMDHVRVHPKFLHSNATSHKWVLGAFAELLDNAMDEVRNGATYVKIDMAKNKKDGSKMLLIEDNGGGMDPDKMRHCMSLGYSAKSKLADTIGQYGNGFKTSTMRLGADVIVFSRCRGLNELRPKQSIGLLSYTFLKSMGKEDIVVPMLDYERRGQHWARFIRSSSTDWSENVETMVQWSPFSSEADLLQQFNQMQDQGTRIFIYNLWEDDQGLLELDFDTDAHDIQIRGVNRDEKNIDMAKRCPNSKHFLTYRHSLRSYAAILYLRIPPGFRIILRGEDVDHHNVVNDMMMSQEITYRPQPGIDGIPKESNMVAVVTVGFVKDAKAHVDVQGFNVYHKNRLIKPFWRVWHPPGSDGRGVIGVLEANFIEPAHDKQGFERTTILARLETRLIQMQRTYWTSNCHKIGYAPRSNRKVNEREAIPDFPTQSNKKHSAMSDKTVNKSMEKGYSNGHQNGKSDARVLRKHPIHAEQHSPSPGVISDDEQRDSTPRTQASGLPSRQMFEKDKSRSTPGLRSLDTVYKDLYFERSGRTPGNLASQENGIDCSGNSPSSSNYHDLALLKEENLQLRERLGKRDQEVLGELQLELQKEKERSKTLAAELDEARRLNVELKKEQESLIDIFTEERKRRDDEEEKMREKLKDASNTIQELLDKARLMEKLPARLR